MTTSAKKENALPAIGFLGFGEVASRFAEALQAAGARVTSYDVLLDTPDGKAKLLRRVRTHAPQFVPLASLLAQADIVLSTVTTDVAVEAARACVPGLGPGQAYVDLNATSPAAKRSMASIVAASGADFVEGAILPAVTVMGAKSKVLVCGERGGEVAALLSSLGLDFHDYGREIGKASTFKLLRSVFSKGVEALLIECLLAGRRAGVEQDLWEEIVTTIDAASFEDVGGNWIRTHGTAHRRRYHELVQVYAVLRGLALDAPMTAATVALFERSTRLRLSEALGERAMTSSDVIATLDARMGAAAGNEKGEKCEPTG